MITTQTCGFCQGSGVVERLEERREDGWYVNNDTGVGAMADAWIAAEQDAPIRWAVCSCPKCAGRGEYEVEHFACKIF